MSDISIEYTGVAETAGNLGVQCSIIVDEIYNLMGTVDELLNHGLYLEQSSAALKTSYEEFSKTMHTAFTGIQGWANLLNTISDAFKNNDAALFADTLSSIDGPGGLELTPEEVTTDPREINWDESRELGGTPVNWNEDRTQITQ